MSDDLKTTSKNMESEDIETIVKAVKKLIDPEMEEFEFSYGKWSKYWIKIKFRRKHHD